MPEPHDLFNDPKDGALLPYDIEDYDAETGCLTAWVRSDIQANEDTHILFSFGRSQGNAETPETWDEDFVRVHHMQADGGTLYDASRYQNNEQILGPVLSRDCSAAGQGLVFDGRDDGVRIPHDESLNLAGKAYTLESWFLASERQCRNLFSKSCREACWIEATWATMTQPGFVI